MNSRCYQSSFFYSYLILNSLCWLQITNGFQLSFILVCVEFIKYPLCNTFLDCLPYQNIVFSIFNVCIVWRHAIIHPEYQFNNFLAYSTSLSVTLVIHFNFFHFAFDLPRWVISLSGSHYSFSGATWCSRDELLAIHHLHHFEFQDVKCQQLSRTSL
jgi:hypothetical protein